MTNIDGFEVTPGDRVRLVNDNGDKAEVTLTVVKDYYLESETNYFDLDEGWHVEEVLARSLPDEDGIFLLDPPDDRAIQYSDILIRKDGQWFLKYQPIPVPETDPLLTVHGGKMKRLVVEK